MRFDAHQSVTTSPLAELGRHARKLRDHGHGHIVTYSRKVFIPLTRLCRDFCHYCTFAAEPKYLEKAYLSVDEALFGFVQDLSE